jgi:hypothetical protein
LVFLGKNWYRLLDSDRKSDLPGKDTVYRFLNQGRYAWRKFLHNISLSIVQSFDKLTSSSRVKVFIVDDSFLQRNRSKKAELLAHMCLRPCIPSFYEGIQHANVRLVRWLQLFTR